MHGCRLNAYGGLPYMDDVCERCYGGELEKRGPVCVLGSQRQSWMKCSGCGYTTKQQMHPCNDMHCVVHGRSTY